MAAKARADYCGASAASGMRLPALAVHMARALSLSCLRP